MLNESNQIKIIDFDRAERVSNDNKVERPHGMLKFLAPECMQYRYGPEADVWSVGVIMHELLTGETDILVDVDPEELKRNYPSLENLISGFFAEDYTTRLNISQLKLMIQEALQSD